MDNKNLRSLHKTLQKAGYNPPPYEQFARDMEDDKNLRGVYSTLQKEGYTPPAYDQFKTDMGFGRQAAAPAAPAQQYGWKQHSTEDDAPGAALAHDATNGEDARGLERTAEDAGTASGNTGGVTPAPGAQKAGGYKPSPSFLFNLHNSVNSYNEGSRRRKEQVHRAVGAMTPAGRQQAKAGKMAAQMAGTPSRVMGLTPPVPKNDMAVRAEAKQQKLPTRGATPYDVVVEDGERKTRWLLPDGRLTTDLLEADRSEYAAVQGRLNEAFRQRMRSGGLDPDSSDDVQTQAMRDLFSRHDADDAAAKAWEAAEARTAESLRQTESNPFLTALPQAEVARAIEARSADMTHHDLQRMADEAWDALGKERQDAIIDDLATALGKGRPGVDEQEVMATAAKIARAQSDRAMVDYAIKMNAPQSATEFFIRKAVGTNAISSLIDAASRVQAGTRGDMLARDEAESEYERQGHRVAGIGGTVTGFMFDPLMLISGGVGGSAVKGASWLAGRYAMLNALGRGATEAVAERFGAAAVRKGMETLGGRLAAGAVGGAANFATFEGLGEGLEQLRMGGYRDPETREVGGYSMGAIGDRAAHGLAMGAATGVVAPLMGNVSDKLVRATESTVGKMGIRIGQLGVSTVSEGTIFATPELIATASNFNEQIKSLSDVTSPNYIADVEEREKKIAELRDKRGDAMMDTWTQNLGMIAGFKAGHALKSAPDRIAELSHSKGESRRKWLEGFETRLRMALDGRHRDLALSQEEREELERNGHADLLNIVDDYQWLSDAERRRKARVDEIRRTSGYDEETAKKIADAESPLPFTEFTSLMTDNKVSASARAKMYYYLTGNKLPTPTILGYNFVEHKDADGNIVGYTVQSVGAIGVITSRNFTSKQRAEVERNAIMRQAELNSIDIGERHVSDVYDEKRTQEACRRVSSETGAPVSILLDIVKNGPRNDVEQKWAERIFEVHKSLGDDGFDALKGMVRNDSDIFVDGGGEHVEGVSEMRTAVGNEFGVDVDKAIRKEPNRRSEKEQQAVDEYAKRLFADIKTKEDAARNSEPRDLNSPSAPSEIAGLLGMGDDDAPGSQMSDAQRRGYDADSQGRRDIAIALADPNNAGNADLQEAWSGVVQRINEEAAYNAAIDHEEAKQMRHTDGSIHPAVLKNNEENGWVYIVDGTVAMTPDGTGIDPTTSDKSVIIYNPVTGKTEMIDPTSSTGLSRLGEVISWDDREAQIESVRQQYVQAMIDDAQGKIFVAPGQQLVLPNGEEAVVVATDADGENITVALGDGTQANVSLAELQRVADEAALADYRQRHSITEEPATQQPEASMPAQPQADGRVAGAPADYTADMELTIRDEDGSEKPAMVMGRVRYENGSFVPDANGNIIEYFMDGEVKHDHEDKLVDKVVSHVPLGGEDARGVQRTGEDERGSGSLEAQRTEGQNDGSAEGRGTEPMPMREVGTGNNAETEPDWMAVTPERGHDWLFGESGLDRSDANEIVTNNLEAAQKAVEKANKLKPKKTTNPFTLQAERERIAGEQEAAQNALDYWKTVQSRQTALRNAELEQSRAEQAERERIAHEQAVADEAARQAEVLVQREEQAQRGAHAVHPAIREKWEAAPKIEGFESEIPLHDGTTVKGRYMLVESGSATPSHNAAMDFARSEGFPVDENGNTINDRDYERDRDAQDVTREMGRTFDSRAIQDTPVVSRDGVVLSGNGRTMAGELAARDNTDGAYLDHLTKFGRQYGFTPEQVSSMQHPRLVFVADEDMPYTTETFAKFNAQQMKSQDRTETAVKLGKTVPDNTFGRIVGDINRFDTLSQFYNDPKASVEAINDLRRSGVITPMQYAEMFDGKKVSVIGRQMLENVLLGKAFESNPDALRELAKYPQLRQSVVAALAEISNNKRLGDYSLEHELSEAIHLAYTALEKGRKQGDVVSDIARQLNLFPFDLGRGSVVDYTNASILMLADVLNSTEVNKLRNVLALYNDRAGNASNGAISIDFGGEAGSGFIESKSQITKDVLNLIENGERKEKQRAIDEARERRKDAAETEQGDSGTEQDGTVERSDSGSAGAERSGGSEKETPSLTHDEAISLIAEMEERAELAPDIELTIENWDALFGAEGRVLTPIGEVKMGENQFTKLMHQGREGKLGMIKPTLENPDVIIEDASEAKDGETTERKSSYVFVKAFKKADGSRYYYFTSVTVSKDGKEVVISNQEKRKNAIANLLTKGKLVWKHADDVSAASDVEQGLYSSQGNMSDPTTEGTDAPQTNNVSEVFTRPALEHDTNTDTSGVDSGRSEGVTTPAGNSPRTSEDKGSENSETGKEKTEKVAESKASTVIAEAEQDVNTEPTDAQKEAGNYKKGHIKLDGFDISIEQPKGSTRSGRDASGKEWSVTMQNTYGYIRGTEGVDGDHIDVFLSDNMDEWNGTVYVIDQVKADGSFDEHKVMYGFNSAEEAAAAYNSNYSEGWQGLGNITGVSKEEFKKWIGSSHRKTKPFADYKKVKTDEGQSKPVVSEDTEETPTNLDEMRAAHPDALFLVRGQRLYKAYGEDAKKLGEILGVEVKPDKKYGFVASFDHNDLDTNLPKLVRAGLRVAITESSSLKGDKPASGKKKTTKAADIAAEQTPASGEGKSGYTVEPAQYTTKRGKVLNMVLVKFGRELTKEEKQALTKFAKDKKGWWDKEKGGFMMRDEATAKQLGDMLGDEEAVKDNQPMSLADVQAVNDDATVQAIDEAIKVEEKPQSTPQYDYDREDEVYDQVLAGLRETLNNANGNAIPNIKAIEKKIRELRKSITNVDNGLATAGEDTIGKAYETLATLTGRMKAYEKFLAELRKKMSETERDDALAAHGVKLGDKVTYKGKQATIHDADARQVTLDVGLSPVLYEVTDWENVELPKQEPTTPQVNEVNVESLMGELGRKGEAKLSDHATPVEEQQQEESTEQPKQEEKKAKSKWVNDEDADRFEELRRRWNKKMRGQANMGIDPEIFTIGVEMGYLVLKKGGRKFREFAKNLLEALGESVRPYIKSIYNGVRDLPAAEAFAGEMTPYDEVRGFDVMNFDKEGAKDIVATAEHIVREQAAEREAKEATDKLKQERNEQRKEIEQQIAADTETTASQAETVASEVESKLPSARSEREVNDLAKNIDDAIDKVNDQLALLGYYEAEPVESDFNEAYGYMRNAEKKAVKNVTELFKTLTKELGISDPVVYDAKGKKQKSVTANIAPAGGDVTMRFMLNRDKGVELYIDFMLEPDYENSRDNLVLKGIMFRPERNLPNGGRDYLRANNFFPVDVTVPQMLQGIRSVCQEWLPAEDYVAMAQRVAAENAGNQQEKPSKERKSKKKSVSLQQQTIPDLFSGLFGEEDSNLKPTSDEQEVHVQPRTGTSEREGGHQREQNEPLGESKQNEDERPDAGGVVRRSGNDTKSDTAGGSRVSEPSDGKRNVKPAKPEPAPLAESERKNTHNNHAERGTDYAPKGTSARIEANIKAIETMQRLIESGEPATPEDMSVLRKFSGWGGLGAAFKEKDGWVANPVNKRLRELLSPEAYEAANLSRNTAYYTPAPIIDAMWDVARAMGFRGGNVLEGSAGIGKVLGQMPSDMSERSNIQAIEVDETTGNILKLLYPDAKVDVQGFEKTYVPNGSVDLAITNVPFGDILVKDETGDKDLSKKFHSIHDFCIAKNVRKLKEGGIGIFITSSGTLDSPNSAKLRTWLVNEGGADVVGAFRMHKDTFGGAGVTSDIIVVRKRVNGRKSANAIDVSGTLPIRTVKYNTGETKRGSSEVIIKDLALDVNKHFVEHPEDMAGEMAFAFEKGGTYRATSKALYPSPSINQEQRLSEWAQQFKDMDWDKAEERESQQVVYEDLGEDVKEGSMLLDSDGNLCLAQRGKAVPINVNANKVKGHTKAECFNAYKAIKDALADVLEYQTTHSDDSGLQQRLAKLNKAYDSFVKTYGHLNKNTSISFLRSDMDYPSIAALESVSETGDKSGKRIVTYGKTDIFSRRVVEAESEPKPTTIKDGIIASIYLNGRVDVPYIAEQLNMSDSDVRQQIIESGLGFENPTTTEMEVSYEYLSGNVREKLRQAQENNTDGRYDANIKALERVIPMNIPAHLIEFTLGSSWVEPKLYEDFVKERTGLDVKLTNAGGTWIMSEPYYTNTEQNKAMGVISEKCDKTILGHELIKAAITCKSISVTKTISTGYGSSKTTETIVDKEATMACANKIDEIRQDFKDWARGKMQGDPEMSERMERVYNELFNNSVPKEIPDEFVPEHFGGAATVVNGKPFKLRPHQAKAVIRATTQPLMLAHEVGTGKTYTLISTAMEMRRLGTARKPMIVVQNATVGQFVASAKALYPNAKILTLEDADRNAEGRRNFYAKIRYNDWDMIVVPQSVFERIPDSEERQIRFVEDKVEEKMMVLEKMREAANDDRDPVLRQAQRELDQLNDELNDLKLALQERKAGGNTEKDEKREAKTRQNAMVKAQEMLDRETDDVANFDDMGIDALLIDEAHEYKHLGFATAMQRGVKGVDPSYSKKSQGVYLKTQAVLENKNGKNVVFATGTPISNTAAEIWTFMRYLMPADTMREYGIYYFDDFVRNFGNIQQMLEFSTNGKYKENNRFAGYVNLPELVRIWAGVADTVLTREAGGVSDKIPKMEGGKAQDIYLQQTKALRGVMKFVKDQLDDYEKMSGKEKKENSHIPLVMYGIAKAAAVDARLVLEDAADEPNSKTNEAVRQTLRSLEDTKEYNGTVAIFADNYQNKATGFNLYEDIRKKLIDAGVPEAQVVVMKSGMSIKKKLEIFDKVNRGEVRVIMGSTFTLGTGVNIQERLHTLIHVDAPNRPMDYTQRNGRILRQGNLHNEWGIPVRVLRFGVEDSLDVTAYQRLKTKGAIADSIMEGKKMMSNSMENRVLEEEQDLFGDITAQLSGSQYALLKNQVEKEVKKLEARKKQWEADQTYVHNQKPRLKALIKDSEERAKRNKEALAKVEAAKNDGITIGKMKFPSLDAMGDYIKDYNSKQREQQEQVRTASGYKAEAKSDLTVSVGGFDFHIHRVISKEQKQEKGQLSLSFFSKTQMTYSCPELGLEDVPVDGQRLKSALEDILENVLSGDDFREKAEYAERAAERYKGELQQVEARDGKPFEYADELKQAKEKLAEYEELMKAEMAEKEAKYAEMDASVEAAKGVQLSDEDSDDVTEDTAKYRIREDEPPTKTGIGYKVFVLKDGKLYPPMVANPNGEATPVGVWLDADAAPVAGVTKTGRQQVKAGGKGTQGGSGKLAYRPGWHLGEIPYALQFNRMNPETGQRELFPANFVWAEVEYANDVDYQEEAMSYGMNASGKFQHSLAGLPRLPENGSYRYRTNPDPNTDPWIITGAMKVNRILKPSEVDAMVEAAGREPQQRQAGAITDEQVEALNAKVKRTMQEDRDMMRCAVQQMGEKWHAPVDVYETADEVTHSDPKEQARRRGAKGWWDPKTGRIGIVLGNHRDVDDVKATMGHETIAHKGLRELIGEERYNEFLDEVYAHLRDDLKARIDERAGRAFMDDTLGDGGRKRSYESHRREQVDELFGEMAQKPFEEFNGKERNLWQWLKAKVRHLLNRFLGSLKLPKWFELGDNELRYMLWRSKERLERGKEHPIDLARDIVKREELGLDGETRYAKGKKTTPSERGGAVSGKAHRQDYPYEENGITLYRQDDEVKVESLFDPSKITLRSLEEGETCNVERKYVENGMFDFTGSERVESSDDVAYIFRSLQTSAIENTFLVLVKDGRPTILHIGMGLYNMSPAHIGAGVLAAQKIDPEKVYFVHNHPSGALEPSRADVEMLNKMTELFQGKMQEAIIIDTVSGEYSTFYTSGNGSSERMPRTANGKEVAHKTYSFSKQVFAPDWNPQTAFQVLSSKDVAAFISSHRLGTHPKMSLLVLDNNNHITGNVFLPYTNLEEVDAFEIGAYVHQMGGNKCILYGNYDHEGDKSKVAVSRLNQILKTEEVQLLDMLHIEHSANDAGWVFEPGNETEDIWNDQSLGLDERITAAATRLANNHRDNRTMRDDAMRAIGGNLTNLRRAMSLQRRFDMTTVKRVADLARVLISGGYLNDMSANEVKRLLSAVKNSVGHNDVDASVQKVMDIMVDNQLKLGEATLHELETIRATRVDARGVEVQGALDPAGAHTIKVFKKARDLKEADIEEQMASAQQRMGSSDAAVADEAALDYTGLQFALEYNENIKSSKAEEHSLREELRQKREEASEAERRSDAFKQYVASVESAIRQNKIDRAQAYFDLVSRLSDNLRESIANAKDFREAEKQRIRAIQHNANSDMEGRPSNEHYKPKFMDKFVNNSFVQGLFAPLATFDQMLRLFGNKSANGEGYLYNRFMRGWVDARHKEIRGVSEKFAVLDAKAKEIFGGKVKTWGDLIRRVGKLRKGTVSFWDGGEKQEHELSQGNLMYIYMVNKMLDGRMKLRSMGISEEDVANIERVLDQRLIELADWLQEEFLVETRNEYNETHKRMFGASMAAIEDYFPLRILENALTDKAEDLDNPGKGTGISTATGSIIKRRRNNKPLDITNADALSVILDHIAEMEHWNAFAEFNRDLNTLRTYKRFRNQVQNMTTIYGSGSLLWKKFNDVCQMAAGTYRPPRAMLDEAAVNFAKGVTAAKVSFRIFTALKQFLSMPAYLPEARPDYLVANLATPWVAWNWCMENLPIFNERWHSRMAGDPRLLKSDMDWKMWRTRIVQLASRVGMSPNAFVDALTVSIGAYAIYKTRLGQYKSDGYGQDAAEHRAKQDAEVLYNQTQQSSEGVFTSTMQVDRSWLSVLFTIFRNASMSYQRQLHDALRNFKSNLVSVGRARSIEFMTKQYVRDGIDEAQAEKNAKHKFSRQLFKDTLRVATFGYILQLAWNLGAYLPYLLFGDDDDEKQKMWDDVWTHTCFGWLEGVTGGDVLSQAGTMAVTGEGNPAYLSKDMPLTSDIMSAFRKLGGGKSEEALTDIVNLVVQSGIGVNPQSITDGVLAIVDACGGDLRLSNEAALCIMRVMQVPQSQLDKIYFDELGMTARKAQGLDAGELARRYARYKIMRGYILTPWVWGDESLNEKYEEKFKDMIGDKFNGMDDADLFSFSTVDPLLSDKRENAVKNRMNGVDENALRYWFENGDELVSKEASLEAAQRLGGTDSYGSSDTEYNQIYTRKRDYLDLAEDVLLQHAKKEAKAAGDDERYKALDKAQRELTDIKKGKHTKSANVPGLGEGDDDKVMEQLRTRRREMLEEFGITSQQTNR